MEFSMMHKKNDCKFGLWDSPISPLSIARGIVIRDVLWDDSGSLVWLESRSDRNILVIQPVDGSATRDLNDSFSVRAKVGYGGGDFCLGKGMVYLVESESGRIYRQSLDSGIAHAITNHFGSASSPVLSPDGHWLLYVHTYEDQDVLAIVDSSGEYWSQKLVSGADFYMQPIWHPEGHHIAWIEWNHPNMPWDGTVLRIAKLDFPLDGMPIVSSLNKIAGDNDVSVFQPEFSTDGRYLAYISDESGWWQLYLYDIAKGIPQQLTNIPAEHGVPAWIQGIRTYGFTPDGKYIYFLRNQDAMISLYEYDLEAKQEKRISLEGDYTYMNQISVSKYGIAMIASGGTEPTRLISISRPFDVQFHGKVNIIRRSTTEQVPKTFYTSPQPIKWLDPKGEPVYGIYYPPHNEEYVGIGKPPLVVKIHGGPTSQRYRQFDLSDQFFASRGYAVLEVNYRGSTGYGKSYRDKLRGNWGMYDVQDAVSGAQNLIDKGLVDSSKMVIMGGSAGGFTVLKALQDYPGFFKAGINLFGVTNQFTLAADTHKFETHYLDTIIGVLPEAAQLYKERSPIYFVDKIKDPLAIFQGEIDKVVPRAQSDELVESLLSRGVPYIYHLYPGEGHGFRKEETIEHMYTEIDGFLRQYVIFS